MVGPLWGVRTAPIACAVSVSGGLIFLIILKVSRWTARMTPPLLLLVSSCFGGGVWRSWYPRRVSRHIFGIALCLVSVMWIMLGVYCVLMEVTSTRLVCRPLVLRVRNWSGVGVMGVWAVGCCVGVGIG